MEQPVTAIGGDPRSMRIALGDHQVEYTLRPICAAAVAPFLASGGDPVRELLNSGSDADWVDLVQRHTPALIDALPIATEISREVIAELNAADLIELCAVTMQLNLDFFVRRARPAIGKLLIDLGRVVQHASRTTSTAPPRT